MLTMRCVPQAFALLLGLLSAGLVVAADDPRWAELKPAFFGDRAIEVDSGIIGLDTPNRAYDAALVPVVVRSLDPERQLRKVHLIVDKNPLPLAGVFSFSEAAGNWDAFETRIRINEYTNVRAIGELADGSLHMVSNFVKASGGCSAPAMADLDAALARAGKMKVFLGALESSESSEAVVKISHPNNSGMQFDQVSRNYIPAFYVDRIGAEIDGRPLFDVETNFSLSENPVVRFQFTPSDGAGEVTVFATDSKGNRFEQQSMAAASGESLSVETPTVQ